MASSRLTRRGFIRSLGAVSAVSAVDRRSGTVSPEASSAPRRSSGSGPNVLVVMSDQHRADYMGCAGHPVLQTPGWDRLAREGVRFRNAYCSYPLCCPSRMSFLTGRYPSEIGCNDNVAQLGSDIPTVAHGFAAAGYDTVLAGRMHIIGFDQRHGFSERIVPDIPGTAFFNAGSWGGRILGPLRDATGASLQSLVKSGPGHLAFHTYDAEVLRHATSWIEKRAELPAEDRRPFFMVAGLILPHPPFVAREEDFDLVAAGFSERDLPDPRTESLHPVHRMIREYKRYGRPENSTAAQLRTLRAYAANCLYTDRLVTQLLDCLDACGLTENTIVVYVSDHGEQMGAHGLWGKNAFYNESMRVPLLVRWPEGIPGGRVVDDCVSLVDTCSTLLRLAGIDELPAGRPGGFVDHLTGVAQRGSPSEVLVEGVFRGGVPARTLRRGTWRYSCYDGLPDELYDLASDPGEFRNLASDGAYRETLADLAQRAHENWDPQGLRFAFKRRSRELPLIREWIESSDLKEPDPPWHRGQELQNYVHAG